MDLDLAVAAVRLLPDLVKVIVRRFSGRPCGGQRWRQVGAMSCNGLFSQWIVWVAFFSLRPGGSVWCACCPLLGKGGSALRLCTVSILVEYRRQTSVVRV